MSVIIEPQPDMDLERMKREERQRLELEEHKGELQELKQTRDNYLRAPVTQMFVSALREFERRLKEKEFDVDIDAARVIASYGEVKITLEATESDRSLRLMSREGESHFIRIVECKSDLRSVRVREYGGSDKLEKQIEEVKSDIQKLKENQDQLENLELCYLWEGKKHKEFSPLLDELLGLEG